MTLGKTLASAFGAPMSSTAAPAREGRSVQVPCTIELSHTAQDCYAHVHLDGIEVGPGDEVLVHGAPTRIGWGEHRVCERQATVSRAGWFARLWTRLTARFELTLLYEVSFSASRFDARRAAPAPQRKAP